MNNIENTSLVPVSEPCKKVLKKKNIKGGLNKNEKTTSNNPVEDISASIQNQQIEPVVSLFEAKKKVLKKKPKIKPLVNNSETEGVIIDRKTCVEIVLDERERDLYEEILKIKTDITISKRVLTIGDVLITKDGEEIPLLIIERKSLQDLLASIKDGRYTEQSFRLLNASGLPPHQILYCIEGMMSSVKSPEEKKRVYSSITSIHYYKGMSVLRTWSVQETAELLVRTAEKIHKETINGKSPYKHPVVKEENGEKVLNGGCQDEYSKTLVSSVKSKNITQKNIGEIMLSQVPSVSIESAKALLSIYEGNFIQFIEALKNNDPLLQEVYFGGEKRRKISGKCLENIRNLLLPVVSE